jgi:thiamine pyrophosphate-dependent acetolactate synthase large subunit-like protein
MQILHVLLDNSELGKISREQVSAIRPVWQTELVNPDFAAYAESCGGRGFRVSAADELPAVLAEAMAVRDRPALVVVPTAATAV